MCHMYVIFTVLDQGLEAMRRSLRMFCSSLSTIQSIPSLWYVFMLKCVNFSVVTVEEFSLSVNLVI